MKTTLKGAIEAAEMVLVAIGKEVENAGKVEFYNSIFQLIKAKDYFVADMCSNNIIYKSDINKIRIVTPCLESDNSEKQWNLYNIWLHRGIAKRLLVIELGMDFSMPNVVRWPLERVVFISNQAKMFRVSEKYAQFPKELANKVTAYGINPVEYIGEVCDG